MTLILLTLITSMAYLYRIKWQHMVERYKNENSDDYVVTAPELR